MKGVYILLINVGKDIQARVGSLGKIKFDKGIYAYLGSAQNNLEKRIIRHRSRNKKMFWHIDYLLDSKFTKIINVFYKKSGKIKECKIADKLNKTEILIPNFGCSDCNCKSHLFRIKNLDIILGLGMKEL